MRRALLAEPGNLDSKFDPWAHASLRFTSRHREARAEIWSDSSLVAQFQPFRSFPW
ncbi:MAG: hypothetical protein RMI91_11645 [Gemmatales bacterium]|nr:hypothetical protein [Gemmatales bacterium]